MQSGEDKRRRPGAVKNFWRRVRKPIAQSRFVKNALATLLTAGLRLVCRTNPPVAGSDDLKALCIQYGPAIFTLWHGQHILGPSYWPREEPLVAMVSKSADGELNALVLEKLGVEVARGSGGREDANHLEKGGARALIALKKSLKAGKNVCLIADIPHGTPRDAGLGIVTLARLSGRPIVPLAIVTSRRKVLEKSWDKTTICLPFGRGTIVAGEPVLVGAEAGADEMERKRLEVTASLDRATEKAYRLVDGIR
jgi:lysophospholipid acyltransferase (LPLAT)-like uncharacterized protein